MLASSISSSGSSSAWDESEALALRAALSAIGAWDGDPDALLEIDSDPPRDNAIRSRKAKLKASTTPYKPRGDQRKQKLTDLRAQVRDLQCVVALSRSLVGPTANANKREASASLSEWEQLANAQRRRRVGAELKNTKLRKLLQTQAAYAKRMLTLCRHVDSVETALFVPPLPSFVDYMGPSLDPVLQLQSLDALIPRAEMVFSSRSFMRREFKPFQHIKYLSSTPLEEGVDFESQAMWLFPADVQRVADAIWMKTMRPTRDDRTCMDVYEHTNSLVVQFMATPSVDNDWGAIQGQAATRILPQDLGDGSVLLVTKAEARSFIDSEPRGYGSFDAWIRIEPVRSPDPTRTGPLSLIKWYRRARFQSPQSSTLTKSERRRWTQAVLAGPTRFEFEKAVTACMQEIGDLRLVPEPQPS